MHDLDQTNYVLDRQPARSYDESSAGYQLCDGDDSDICECIDSIIMHDHGHIQPHFQLQTRPENLPVLSSHRVRKSVTEEIGYPTQWTKIFLRAFLCLLITGSNRVRRSVTEEIRYLTQWTKILLCAFLCLLIIHLLVQVTFSRTPESLGLYHLERVRL